LAPPDLNCEKLLSPVGSIEEALERSIIGLLGLVLSFVIQEDTSFDVNFGLTGRAQPGITGSCKFPFSKPINEFALSRTASRPYSDCDVVCVCFPSLLSSTLNTSTSNEKSTYSVVMFTKFPVVFKSPVIPLPLCTLLKNFIFASECTGPLRAVLIIPIGLFSTFQSSMLTRRSPG